MAQVQTINLKGNEYATVPQRLKAFREANPRASVVTKPEIQADGTVVFTAKIVKDKSQDNSAEATGHSYGKSTDDKAFEKLETVAVGRALAILGYLNNGQIATTEEMEEFEQYQLEQIVADVEAASTRDEFMEILKRVSPEMKKEITPIINRRIKDLKGADNGDASTS